MSYTHIMQDTKLAVWNAFTPVYQSKAFQFLDIHLKLSTERSIAILVAAKDRRFVDLQLTGGRKKFWATCNSASRF